VTPIEFPKRGIDILPRSLLRRYGVLLYLLSIGVASLPCAFAAARLSSAPEASFAQPSSTVPQITYAKVLKGSNPEYEKITVNAEGAGTYDGRKLSDPPNPRHFKLSDRTTQKVFSLAASLNNFRTCTLESHKRVANLGLKSFQYEEGTHVNRCQFNYSTNRTAQELTDLLESIGVVERHIIALDYAMKYDHLGLPRELTLIQIDLDNKALVDPQMMVKALLEITHNPRFLHLAQARAENILQEIQRQ
jgi:hypothetical protein